MTPACEIHNSGDVPGLFHSLEEVKSCVSPRAAQRAGLSVKGYFSRVPAGPGDCSPAGLSSRGIRLLKELSSSAVSCS